MDQLDILDELLDEGAMVLVSLAVRMVVLKMW